VPAPQRLAAAERRRAGMVVKLSLVVADEACAAAALDPATLATVFASSSGDGANCHALCEALAGPDRLISPTRFTNSVHNAPAGYWHIAIRGMASSTSLCAHDASFASGLLEAVLQVRQSGQPVLLVCGDSPYPEPLNGVRTVHDSVGVALVLGPDGDTASSGTPRLSLSLNAAAVPLSTCTAFDIDALRLQAPAGRALPLTEALACVSPAAPRRVVVEYQPSLHLQVEVSAP
jgi:hypothetical protein